MNKCFIKLFLLSILVSVSLFKSSMAIAGTINIIDPYITKEVTSIDDSVTIKLIPPSPLKIDTISSDLLNLLNAEYDTWSFSDGDSSNGIFNITQYDAAFSGSNSGGGIFRVTYDNVSSLGSGTSLRWIQMIDTNEPLGGPTSPYLDPRPNDDAKPFYWTDYEISYFSSGNKVSFSDFSRRETFDLTTPTTWNASLYLVEYDGNTSVSIKDGISWGWKISSNEPFIPTPVPEPSSAILGFMGLAAILRKRKNI